MLLIRNAIAALLFSFLLVQVSFAQTVKTPPPSKKAAVTEYIGLTKVHIDYHRPAVRERTIFGDGGIVPYNGGNPWPWRAGANETTVIYFADDVLVNGNTLPAGKYGFHIIPAADKWTLIFSNNPWTFGSFNYNPEEDALRVEVTPTQGEHVEWLQYQFVNQTTDAVDIELAWASTRVSFTISADIHAVTKASIKREMDGLLGFSWQGAASAAQYFLTAEKDYEKGLEYANRAANPNFGGQANFTTLQVKSGLLDKMGQTEESKKILDEALGLATMRELHFYGRGLIQQGKNVEALEIFEKNRANNPEDKFTTLVGLARGHMATERFEEAAKYFKQAAENAPANQQQAYLDLAKQCEEKI